MSFGFCSDSAHCLSDCERWLVVDCEGTAGCTAPLVLPLFKWRQACVQAQLICVVTLFLPFCVCRCSVATGYADLCFFNTYDIDMYQLVRALEVTAQLASLLGYSSDAAYYSQAAAAARAVYAATFYHASSGAVGSGFPVNQALALDARLPPAAGTPAAFAQLLNGLTVSNYAPFHPTGGIIFSKHVYPVLTEFNRTDVAYAMLLADGFPSFGAQIAMGATTLWEEFQSTNTTRTFVPPQAARCCGC